MIILFKKRKKVCERSPLSNFVQLNFIAATECKILFTPKLLIYNANVKYHFQNSRVYCALLPKIMPRAKSQCLFNVYLLLLCQAERKFKLTNIWQRCGIALIVMKQNLYLLKTKPVSIFTSCVLVKFMSNPTCAFRDYKKIKDHVLKDEK